MIEYYTDLPIKDQFPDNDQFLEIVRESRLYELSKPIIDSDNQHILPADGNDTCEVISIVGEKGQMLVAQYQVVCENGALYKHTHVLDRKCKKLTIYCDSVIPSGMLDEARFQMQGIFHTLINRELLADDHGLTISDKPHAINSASRNIAAKVILREDEYDLPVIFVSMTKNGAYQISPYLLAEQFAGVAHVIYENSDSISGILRQDTWSRNPYNGSIGIYFPGGSRTYTLHCNTVPREKLIDRIAFYLRGYMRRLQIPVCKTFEAFEKKQLEVNRELLENDNTRIQVENSELYDIFEAELEKSKEMNQALLEKNAALMNENASLRAQLALVKEPALLGFEPSDELYPGEMRDIVQEILSDSLDSVREGSRRAYILSSLLDKNNYCGEQKKRKQDLKILLRKYNEMEAPVLSGLSKLGFRVVRSGNHYIMQYYNSSQSITVSKTPSDARSGANLAQKIIQQFM